MREENAVGLVLLVVLVLVDFAFIAYVASRTGGR
jgi:hypothetical protein